MIEPFGLAWFAILAGFAILVWRVSLHEDE